MRQTTLCMESGGIIDDIFLSRLADRWLMVVNASNAAKDLAWMRSQSKGFDVQIRDISPETCMIALQGPGRSWRSSSGTPRRPRGSLAGPSTNLPTGGETWTIVVTRRRATPRATSGRGRREPRR
ncbi:MAG: hypothetical protein IMZ69_02725 [Spirochaetes bacterium]|nr:hypothetical protein [Spirochaetota bacterium]